MAGFLKSFLFRSPRLIGGVLPFCVVLISSALVFDPTTACACAVDPNSVSAHQPTIDEAREAFRQAGSNQLPPSYFSLPNIEANYPNSPSVQSGSVPCILLQAVGYIESSWHHAHYSVPRGANGPALQSFDCGYGIMQITSGMTERDVGIPSWQQDTIAADYLYNIGWGAKMLVEKWNWAPYRSGGFTIPYVRPRDPAVVEDWYFATWAYNGFAYVNNPNNCLDRQCPRPAYNGSQPRWWYPYQELVWGIAANPPTQDGVRLWDPVPLTLPPDYLIGHCPNDVPGVPCPESIERPGPSHIVPCETFGTFSDVPTSFWAYSHIEAIYRAGITSGCSTDPLRYCPNDALLRSQIAVFLLRAMNHAGHLPPFKGYFIDVPAAQWYTPYAEHLYEHAITTGCAFDPATGRRFCPHNPVTRAEMAVLIERSLGRAPVAPRGIFQDVPSNHWAAGWIEKLYADGITAGCGTNPLRYCPDALLTRAEMAVFVARAWGIPL